MDRRTFLKSAFAPIRDVVSSTEANINSNKNSSTTSVFASKPVLQNYAATSVGIAFCVSCLAVGYVKFWKESEKESQAIKVKSGGYRFTEMSDFAIQVRLTDLEPATNYCYKVGAQKVTYKNNEDIEVSKAEESSVYKLTTAGQDASSHFCVINDTHNNNALGLIGYMLNKELKPDFLLLNGDIANREENLNSLRNCYFFEHCNDSTYGDHRSFFANTPMLLNPGNHELRGKACLHNERAFMYRQPDERDSKYWDLGRNFAVRSGDIAIIGMDTGEDKQDDNEKLHGITNIEPYLHFQTEWLKEALEMDEIKNAPFLIFTCHIPLLDLNPRENGGDVRDKDGNPDYDYDRCTNDAADWKKLCAREWIPLLEKYSCQLVVAGHRHAYLFNAATAKRPWAHIIGGGPKLGSADAVDYPTIIDINVLNEGKKKLEVSVWNLNTRKIVEKHYFDRKKWNLHHDGIIKHN